MNYRVSSISKLSLIGFVLIQAAEEDETGKQTGSASEIMLTLVMSMFLFLVLFFVKARVFPEKAPEGYKLPPVYSVGAPVFGNLAGFVKSPLDFMRQARSEVGGIFTMDFVVEKVTFLIGVDYHAPFFEATDVDMDQAQVYQFMTPIFGRHVVYDAPLKDRRQQYRLLGSALKPSMLRTYPDIIARETRNYLKQHWGASGKVDLLPSMAELIILTASATLMGPEVRNELFKEMSELYELLDKGLTPLSVIFPNVPIEPHRKRDFARREIGKLFGKVIDKRQNAENDQKYTDLLQKLIDFKYKDGRKLSHDAITGLLVATMFAGQHTSSITTTWTLLFLLTNPKELNKVLGELANVGNFGQAKEVTSDMISSEKKLYNCIKESIRLHPPLILLMRRVTKAATTVDGHYIPVGHRVVVSNAIAQRLPEVFEDPDEWKPSRWDDFDISKLPKYSFIGFGAGIHTCMGESFAFMQIRTILSVILSMYDMELEGEMPGPNYEAMVVPPKGPNFVKYKLRTNLDEFKTEDDQTQAYKPSVVTEVKEGQTEFTLEEIAKHNTKDDLWIIVRKKVYDVTTFLDLHQGGDEAILQYGGKDATKAVYGPQHPGTVPTLLERYLVGDVKY